MDIELIVDDRENASHVIRTKISRRSNKILFHLLKLPFADSDGRLVTIDRRSGYERRGYDRRNNAGSV